MVSVAAVARHLPRGAGYYPVSYYSLTRAAPAAASAPLPSPSLALPLPQALSLAPVPLPSALSQRCLSPAQENESVARRRLERIQAQLQLKLQLQTTQPTPLPLPMPTPIASPRPDLTYQCSLPRRRTPTRLPVAYFGNPAAGMLLYGNLVTEEEKEPPRDLNKANLGKTLRILQDCLPTLLQSPLPQSILAPTISLHLFPSTHPHLPAVSGRVAYNAALWTSPIAWNRVPLVGNVRVEVVSERMTRDGLPFGGPRRAGSVPEQLVVRWKSPEPKKSSDLERKKEFTGLFIFQFDSDGRILSHTIEHAQTGDGWEKGMGARVVGLTDWLLGGIKGEGEVTGI